MSAARVLVTRSADQAALAALLGEAGYEPVVVPTMAVEPLADLTALDGALRDIGAYRWVILASANAAHLFGERLAAARVDGRALGQTELVAGPAGARVLHAAGLTASRIVSPFSAAALGALASDPVEGERVLLPRAEGGRDELAAGLRARGAVVDEVSLYRTVPVTESVTLVAALQRGVDAVTFFSPSAVRGFVAAARCGGVSVEDVLDGAVVACLGITTAAEASAHGLRVDVVPDDTASCALVEALVKRLTARREVVWSA